MPKNYKPVYDSMLKLLQSDPLTQAATLITIILMISSSKFLRGKCTILTIKCRLLVSFARLIHSRLVLSVLNLLRVAINVLKTCAHH